MALKLYFMKCPEIKVSQYILAFNNDFIFALESVYFILCCSITNAVISLVAHKTY